MIKISKDKSLLQIDSIHKFLEKTYWAKGRTYTEVEKSIQNSLCYGVYLDGKQIGFARVTTDYVVFAYLMDIFILPEYRGKGYAKELINTVINDKTLENCTVWMLKTMDAHELYRRYGFTELQFPDRVMEFLKS